MAMPDLSSDLVEEILSRVPATSLRRLRSTCKRWNSLFKDPRFKEKQLRRAPKQPRCVLMLKEHRIFPMSVDLNVVPPSIKFEDALSLQDSHSNNSGQVDIAKVFHCDGLLLCITRDNRPVVWNPCLGETRWIQHKNGYKRNCRFALGYENNQSCRIYKILMFWDWESDGFEIYELSSYSWRVVKASNCIRTKFSGVCLKGNTYWISSEDNVDKDNYLLCFDFTRERFRRFCLPPSLYRHRYMALSVSREEQLSVLNYNYTYVSEELEMWVTNKIDTEAELSWSKSFSVSFKSIYRNGIPVFTGLLIDEEKKVVLCCNSCYGPDRTNVVYTIGEDDESYTEIPYIKGSWGIYSSCVGSWWPFIFNYVPSLVQIQSK